MEFAFHRWITPGILTLACAASLCASTFPAGFSDQEIGNSWTEPVGLTFDPSPQRANRVYVWELTGRVWIVENGVRLGTPLIDLRDEVGAWRDYGMLGFALHPNFQQNGYIYLFYVVDRHHLLHAGTPDYDPAANEYFAATIGRITRYTARASDGFRSVNPASRKVLVGATKSTGFPILHESHGVGHLAFGTDGTLLASCGDAASYKAMDDGSNPEESYAPQGLSDGIIRVKENVGAFRSQLVDSLNGKIIRIDPATGNGLPSNPFYDSAKPRAPKSRVWALGLRNPYRMTIRPETGSHDPAEGNPGVIVLGDVGWESWEDINVIDAPGQNCGWPLFEGLTANSLYQASPAINRDARNPLGGFFKFRDLLIQDTLLKPSWPNPRDPSQQIPSSIPRFVHRRPVIDYSHPTGPARTGIFDGDTADEINIGAPGSPVAGPQFVGNASTGGVFYTGEDFPSTYNGTYFHADYGGGWIKNIIFDASNRPIEVRNFGLTGPIVCLATHPTEGSLYYADVSGIVGRIVFAPGGNFPPSAAASADVTIGPSPLTVSFSSAGSDDPDDLPLEYLWNFGDNTTSTQPNPTHVFTASQATRFDVTLTVTDEAGASDQAGVAIFVNHTLPQVTLLSPIDGAKYSISEATEYALTRRVVEAPGHPTTTFWQVFLHHNEHEHFEPPVEAPEALAHISPTYSTTETYYYRVQLTVVDDLGASVQRNALLFPNASNIAPAAAWSMAQTTRPPAPTRKLIDINATASDSDSPGIEFGELRVTMSGTQSDRLSIIGSGQVHIAGANVSYGGIVVGTWSVGTSTQAFLVTFNEAATPAAAQAILRRIAGKFPSVGTRILSLTLADGDGGTSPQSSLSVNVTN